MKLSSHLIYSLSCLLIFIQAVLCADLGFSYGTIMWTSMGNVVNFTVQTAFQQPVDGISVGDIIDLTGQESPQFLYGDSLIAQILQMTVVAFSQEGGWILGNVYLTHHYATPTSPSGEPWQAQYIGCCRLNSLLNNAAKPWVLTAEIDLNLANASPLPRTLPTITAPFVNGATPAIYLPADDSTNVEWSLGTPFDVGGSIMLAPVSQNSSSYMQVKVGQLQLDAMSPVLYCDVTSSAPGCLFRLLQVNTDIKGFTVEGWLKSAADEGGYLVTSQMNSSVKCSDGSSTFDCSVATLLIMMNGTHVMVGHQTFGNLSIVAFDPCQARDVCETLDASYGPRTGGPLTNRWMHLAIVRSIMPASLANCGSYGVQYAAFLNGMPIGTSALSCPPQASGSRFDVLTFGALGGCSLPRSSALGEQAFSGYLQEWRLWNGALSVDEIQDVRLMPLRPDRVQYTGDPTVGQVTALNYQWTAVLLADYAFDFPCPASACPVSSLLPVFPAVADERLRAYATGNVTSAASDSSGAVFWRSAVNGPMGLNSKGGIVLTPPTPGLYQVTIYMSFSQGVGKIPVDFVVQVVPAQWDVVNQGYMIVGAPGTSGTSYIPQVTLMGAVTIRTPDTCGSGQGSGLCVMEYVGGTAAMDLSMCSYPACRIRGFAGTSLSLDLGRRQAGMDGLRNGFEFGVLPQNFRLMVMEDNRVELNWTPCSQQMGFSTVCLNTFAFQPSPSISSQMFCIEFEILRDPVPVVQLMPSMQLSFTMGRQTSFTVMAMSSNCIQQLSIDPSPDTSMPAGMVVEPPQVTTGGACPGVARVVMWRPVYDAGGLAQTLCFAAAEMPSPLSSACPDIPPQTGTGCVMVQVERCRYALGQDQELQQVAAGFATDWMRLWSLNPDLLHPDYILFANQVLWVGHLFRAVGGETPGALAERMGMDLSLLQMLNNDIDTSLPLSPGQVLCVVPNSCGGTAATVYSSIEYKEPSFFAAEVADTMPIPGQLAAQIFEAYPPT